MGPPFDRHPTSAADIRTAAEGLSQSHGQLTAVVTALDGPGRQAADATDGVIDGQIRAPVDAAQKTAMNAAAGATLCKGAVELYADHVELFDRGVDDINARWANAVKHDFFVPDDEPERDDAIEDARGEEAAALRKEYAQLEEQLDTGAAYTAAALKAGPEKGNAYLKVHKAASAAALSYSNKPEYTALGDSYSAGTGIGRYYTRGFLKNPFRSDQAYPWLLARRIGLRVDHRATNGATTYDIDKHQLTGLGPDTKYVTLTAGGNNVGFSSAIKKSLLPGDGPFSLREIEKSKQQINATLPGELDDLYREVRQRAPNATVVVGTYPRLFDGEETKPGGNHGYTGGVTVREERAMNEAADELAAAVERRATAHGFETADVRDHFTGHDVQACGPDDVDCPDMAWINGLVVRYPAVFSDSFHPNALGHEGYAEVFEEYFRR